MVPVRFRVADLAKLSRIVPRHQSILKQSTLTTENVKYHVKTALEECSNHQLCNIQFVYTNGMQGGLFSEAENVIVQQGVRALCDFEDVFRNGVDVANKFVKRGIGALSGDEKQAVVSLINYFDNIAEHEKIIKDVHYAQQYYCSDDAEAETIVCLVEHLLKWLVPTKKYIIDQSSRQTRNGCCSCGTKSTYGATGSGNPLVWHGNLDVIVDGCHHGQSVIKFCPSSIILDKKEDVVQDTVWEVLLCDPSVYDLEEESTDPQHDQKIQILNEIVAQTITFSFLQRRLMKRQHYLTPGIIMEKTSFGLFLYDCEKDILLKSTFSTSLFVNDYVNVHGRHVFPNLNPSAVVYLWFILNHGLFSSEIPKEISSKPFQSGFHSLVGEKLQIYKKDMRSNVSHFPEYPPADTKSMSDVKDSIKDRKPPNKTK